MQPANHPPNARRGRSTITKQVKPKSAESKTIGELISSLLRLDVENPVGGSLNALLETKLWKSLRKDVRDKALDHGGCLAGIQALRAHPESWLIQREACQLLIALSHEREDIKRIIMNLDGLVVIADAMKASIGSVGLQHAACNALNRLGMWELDQEKALHPKVIATLIAVAKAHTTDVYICKYVCRMLEQRVRISPS